MTALKPEDVDQLFVAALNTGKLEELVALYETEAALMATSREVVTGTAAVREALAGFLSAKPNMSLTPRLIAQTGDLAVVSAKWEVSMIGPDGNPAKVAGESVEVMRRQPDGRWFLAIDLPWGIGGVADGTGTR